MKPLSEWTTEDLQYIASQRDSQAALAELLRRKERETIERCAKMCDERAESERQAVLVGRDDASVDVEWELRDMASQIRGLQ